MPTLLKSGPYRFFFYSSDGVEPPHVHVERDESAAKFWLEPMRLQTSSGFGRAELTKIAIIIMENKQQLTRAWHAYFGT